MNQKKQIIIDSGFIQLHRKLLDWEWYTDINTKSLFIHILLKANHSGKNWRGIDIKRGSFVTSVNKLSLETGLSVKNVRTALSHLEQTSEVARSTSSINTTITVLNYDNYQSGGKVVASELASELANKGQGSGKVVATTNNYNNDNNDNKYTNSDSKKDNKPSKTEIDFAFSTFYENYGVKKSKEQARKAFNKLNAQTMQKVLDVVQSEEFQKHQRSLIKNNGDFRQHPSTWLNAGGWGNDFNIQNKTSKPSITTFNTNEEPF